MKTKTCDICKETVNYNYLFWSEIIVPEPTHYDREATETLDVCNKCYKTYIWPAIVAGMEKERLKKGGESGSKKREEDS